jgi:type IV pilus assembly protein PilP
MTARLLLTAALLGLAACGGGAPKGPATANRPQPPPVAAAATATPAPDASKALAEPDYVYSSIGKRDPFRSFLSEIAAESSGLATRCATPLGRYDLEELKLVAVVTGLADPVAMVEAPNGVGYALHRGVCIGKNGGLIVAIRSGELVVSEWVVRADGTRESTQTSLRIPQEAAPKLEE